MKKIAVLMVSLLLTVILCSCAGEKTNDDILAYQNTDYTLSGVWYDSGKEYGIELTSKKNDNGERNTDLLFTSPAELEGIRFIYRDTFLSVSVGEMAIDLETREPDKMMRLIELTTLDKSGITEIKNGKNDKTVTNGKSKSSVWQVTTDSDGLPTEISLTKDGISSRLVINKFSIDTETETGKPEK